MILIGEGCSEARWTSSDPAVKNNFKHLKIQKYSFLLCLEFLLPLLCINLCKKSILAISTVLPYFGKIIKFTFMNLKNICPRASLLVCTSTSKMYKVPFAFLTILRASKDNKWILYIIMCSFDNMAQFFKSRKFPSLFSDMTSRNIGFFSRIFPSRI